MQETQAEGKTFVESTTVNNMNGEFEQRSQTAVPPAVEAEMEFVRTHYSPRGVMFVYFEGDAASEVEKHFNRTFSELCYLPALGSRPDSLQGGVPMPQRNLPPSFRDPSNSHQSSQHTGVTRQNNEMPTAQYNNQSTGYHGNGKHSAPNFLRTRSIPITYAELPAGAVKSVAPCSAPPARTLPFPRESAAQYNAPQASSLTFNPGYNALLVQPEVKPHLPLVPGERRKPGGENKDLEGFNQ